MESEVRQSISLAISWCTNFESQVHFCVILYHELVGNWWVCLRIWLGDPTVCKHNVIESDSVVFVYISRHPACTLKSECPNGIWICKVRFNAQNMMQRHVVVGKRAADKLVLIWRGRRDKTDS